MNNEDILSAAQAESHMGEYELSSERKALAYGGMATVMLCMLLIVAEVIIKKQFDFGKPALLFCMAGFTNLFRWNRLKNKRNLAAGIIEILFALIGIVLFIGALLV